MMFDLKNIKKDFSPEVIFWRISKFLRHNVKVFVFSLLFLLAGYCVYIWYSRVYHNEWSEEKKADYLQSKDKEVTFNRQKFQEIIEKEKERAEEYKKTIKTKRDIFGIK